MVFPVSLCVIVRDEQATLADCLRPVADLFADIILVATGSSDRTKEIATQLGARVVDFPWCDDFAAARNESLRHATGEWIFWLDADDRLDDAYPDRLCAPLAGLGDENAAYVLTSRSASAMPGEEATDVGHVRLFRNRPDGRWQYRVHEQILPALVRAQTDVRWTDIVIEHTGYRDPALRRRKVERNLQLLHLDHADHPDDPFILFNLGWSYLDLGRPAEALAVLRQSLERCAPGVSIVRKLYALLARTLAHLGQLPEALAACRAGLARCPGDPELLLQEGLLLQQRGDLRGAEARWLRLVPPLPVATGRGQRLLLANPPPPRGTGRRREPAPRTEQRSQRPRTSPVAGPGCAASPPGTGWRCSTAPKGATPTPWPSGGRPSPSGPTSRPPGPGSRSWPWPGRTGATWNRLSSGCTPIRPARPRRRSSRRAATWRGGSSPRPAGCWREPSAATRRRCRRACC
jgi:hypothetical protein